MYIIRVIKGKIRDQLLYAHIAQTISPKSQFSSEAPVRLKHDRSFTFSTF
jgi:hypothetical protein